jgi:DnaJ-class molecular chaperone
MKRSGGKDGISSNCKACRGRGFVTQYRKIAPGMVQQMQGICRDCSGKGEIINEKNKCKDCNGKKIAKQKKTFEVHVDKGMQDDQKIIFKGESNQEVT